MKKYILLAIAALTLFSACQKDNIDVFVPDPMVVTNVQGIIQDESGNPVEGATATFNARTTSTDINGFFEFENVSVNAKRAYVTVQKSGYFHGSRAFTPKEGNTHKISVQLMEATTVGNFDSSSGGTINFANGASALFPENAVINEATGVAYSGQVDIAAKFLSPDAPNIMDIMPGDLTGITTSGQEQGLRTFGMIALDMTAPNGDALQLAEGSQAVLTFPVPADFQSLAPATIPLWTFDEVEGIWKEEGQATLQGDNYVGSVTHFSYWNCDAPFPLVEMEGRLVDQNGNPLKYTEVRIGYTDQGYPRSGFTNEDGVFGGKIPKNENLVLEVIDLCGGVAYSQNIGPFSSDTDLGDIVIDLGSDNYTSISGTITDCDGNPVTNGYVKVIIGGQHYEILELESDGSFQYSFNACNFTEVEVIGYDLDNVKETPVQSFPIATNIDAGSIKTCESLSLFIEYTLNGTTDVLMTEGIAFMLQDTVGSGGNTSEGGTYLEGRSNPNGGTTGEGFFMNVAGNEVGTFPLQGWFYFDIVFPDQSELGNNTIMVTFTEYGLTSGEDVAGTFSGTFTDTNGVLNSIEGSFRLPLQL